MMAGMTTFITMSYLLLQCASILSSTGAVSQSVAYLAICVSAAVGSIVLGFWANQPLVLAPSLGMTVFFSSTLVGELHYSYPQALAITLIGGLIFLLLSALGLQNALYAAIPKSVKDGVSAGLGLYIALIGIKNAGLITTGASGLWELVDFSELSEPFFTSAVMLMGLLLTVFFKRFRVPFPILFGILCSGVLYFVAGKHFKYVGTVDLNADEEAMREGIAAWLKACFGKNITSGFIGLFKGLDWNLETVLTLVLVVLVCAVFNSVESGCVIYATARNGGMLDENGNFGFLKTSLLANSVASLTSSCCGAPMTTVAAESNAGVSAGGKSGLTSITTGLLLLVAGSVAGFVDMIPPVVTACAMIYVGMSMLGAVRDVDFGELSECIPAFLTVVIIAFTSSVIDGIAMGIMLHIAAKILSLQFKSLKLMELALCAVFVAAFRFL